jgi:hypothetical protein
MYNLQPLLEVTAFRRLINFHSDNIINVLLTSHRLMVRSKFHICGIDSIKIN